MPNKYPVHIEGGWGSRTLPDPGEDGRSLRIRVGDPDNGRTVLELEIPAATMLDLLTNHGRSGGVGGQMTFYSLDVMGKRADMATVIIDRPDSIRAESGPHKGSQLICLDEAFADEMREGGWSWDLTYNGHKVKDRDRYSLDMHRLVEHGAPHPSDDLRRALSRGLIHEGKARCLQGDDTDYVNVAPPALRTADGAKLADIAKGTAPARKGKRK